MICPCKASLDHTPLESFTLGFKSVGEAVAHQREGDLINSTHTVGIPRDTISQFLRAFLLKLSIAESLLQPIPPGMDTTFYVMLQLGDNYIEDVEQCRVQGDEKCKLPWVQTDSNRESAFEDAVVIPLKSAQNEVVQLQLYVQERKDLKVIK